MRDSGHGIRDTGYGIRVTGFGIHTSRISHHASRISHLASRISHPETEVIMDLSAEIEQLRTSLNRAEYIQTELDRRVFHLKTLYDVSKDIFSSVEFETILRIFLMMTMGNFGVMEGFILVSQAEAEEITNFVSVGLEDEDTATLRQHCKQLMANGQQEKGDKNPLDLSSLEILPPSIGCAFQFSLDNDCCGMLGLGPKLIGEPYNDDDKELLSTLANNLIVALKNARSFEEIKRLNEDLQATKCGPGRCSKQTQSGLEESGTAGGHKGKPQQVRAHNRLSAHREVSHR